jgi:hypothetical protein
VKEERRHMRGRNISMERRNGEERRKQVDELTIYKLTIMAMGVATLFASPSHQS